MWTRVELRIRRGWRAIGAALGTAPMAGALLALAAIALAVAQVLARLRGDEAADAFSRSLAFDLVGAGLAADAAVGLARRLAEARGEGGSRLTPSAAGALASRGGYLLLAAAFGVSLLARDGVRLRVSEGEDATAEAAQIVGRDAWRTFSRGVGEVAFTVVAVGGRMSPEGAASGIVADVRGRDGAARRTTALRPLLDGWTRTLRPVDAGYALRYELAVEKGAVLDAAVAKLALGQGQADSIRSPAMPHRVIVRLAPKEPGAPAGVPPLFDVAVYRGKLLVARGRVASGGSLAFEGLVLRLPEVRRWVELRLVRDPGLPVALAGAALVLAGLVARRAFRARRPPEGA